MNNIKKRELVGNQITLKPLNLNNYSMNYINWLNNIEINSYLESRFTEINKNKIEEYINEIYSSNNSILFGIFFNKNKNHIGNIKIGTINWNHYFTYIGYFVGDKTLWGKGIATEAIVLATYFSFQDLGLYKCKAGVYSTNLASIRALEKAGYAREGCFKDDLIGPKGREDWLIYGISKNNWKINKKSIGEKNE